MPSHLWWPLFDLYKLQFFLFPFIPSSQCDVDQREEWGQVWKTVKVLLTQENSRSGTSRCLMTLYIVFILQGKHCYMSPHPLLKTVGVSVFSDLFIIDFSESFPFLMKKKSILGRWQAEILVS